MEQERREAGERVPGQDNAIAASRPGLEPGKVSRATQAGGGKDALPFEAEADAAAGAVMGGRAVGAMTPAAVGVSRKGVVTAAVATAAASTPTVIVDDSVPPKDGQLAKGALLAKLEPQLRAVAERELGLLGKDCPYITRYLAIYRGKPAREVESFVRRYAHSTATTADGLIADLVSKAAVGVHEWKVTHKAPAELAAADPAAAAVADQPHPAPGQAQTLAGPQRKADGDAPPAGNGSGAILSRLGEGAPLDAATAARMSSAFGASFTDVRIHADEQGAKLAAEESAQAFTLGNHVAFASGKYQPGTPTGDALLAHELAHVLQQRGSAPTTQRKRSDLRQGVDGAEHDADSVAAGVVQQLHGGEGEKKEKPQIEQSSDLKLQRCWESTANPSEQEWLDKRPIIQTTETLQGDKFEIGVAFIAGKGSARPMLSVNVTYTGDGDADAPAQALQIYLKKSDRPKPTAKGDKPTDWSSLTIDTYGDGSVLSTLGHACTMDTHWTPATRTHDFTLTGDGDKSVPFSVRVKSKDALPISADQQKADPDHKDAPVLKSDVATASAKMTLDEMLADSKFGLVASKAPWVGLKTHLDEMNGKPPGKPEDALRLTRIQETLSKVRPAFLALGAAGNKDAYLPDIAEAAVKMVADVKTIYEAALANVWAVAVDLSPADHAFAALWPRLTNLYLQKGKGAEAQLQGASALANEIRANHAGEKNFDHLLNAIGAGGSGVAPASDNALHVKNQIELARSEFESGKSGALAKAAQAVDDTQVISGLCSMIATDQYLHKAKAELAGITAKAVDKAPFTRDLNAALAKHIAKLEDLGQAVEDPLVAAKTPDAIAAVLRGAGRASVNQYQQYCNTDEFKDDLKDVTSRIKTVKVINGLLKAVAIIGVSAVTGGAAAAWAGAALEGAGASAGVVAAGTFGAEVVGFTLTTRLMNQAIDGKNDTGLVEDLATNALMMGSLKIAGEVYGKAFKMVADPKKYQTAFKAGGMATSFVALQMFAETHELAKNGKLMDGDDRMRSLLSNALTMGALELGGYLKTSLTKLPEMKALAAKNAGKGLSELNAQLSALGPLLAQAKAPGEPGQQAAADLVPKLMEAWQKQLDVMKEAVDGEKDPTAKKQAQEKLQAATAAMNGQLAKFDLQLASAGLDVQGAPGTGGGSHYFEPLKPGYVKFKPEGKAVIDSYYKERSGKLEKVPGKDGLYRGVDGTGETFFVEEGKADSFIDKEAGANKGKDVYPEATYMDGADVKEAKLNPKKLKNALDAAAKSPPPDAKLKSIVEGNPATLNVELTINGAVTEISVEVSVKPKTELADPKVHDGDAGPARFSLTRDATGKWSARVDVSERMRPEDVKFAVDHELAEAAELVRRNPGGPPKEGFTPQMEAGVMKAGATTDKSTAHDVAAAREVVELYKDLQNLRKSKAKAENIAARKAVLDRAMEAQGLNDPSQVPAKIDLLRKAGAPQELLDVIENKEAQRVFDDLQVGLGGRKSTISVDAVKHVLFPAEAGETVGVKGGHHTVELTNYADAKNPYSCRETRSKSFGGTTYRSFEQYTWKGDAAAKPKRGSPEGPGGAKFDASKWTKVDDPKTTFDDPAAFIADAEAGYHAWLAAHTGAMPNKVLFTSPGGIDCQAYVANTEPGTPVTSVFPRDAWIP